MTVPSAEFLGELRIGRQLATVSQVAAVGLAVMAGLLFLLAGPVLDLAGSRAALAGILAGAVLGLTLLNVLELLGGSGDRGGTYVLIHETLGGVGAFLAGWSILAASAGLSAALIQAAASHVLLVAPRAGGSTTNIALALFGALVLVALFQLLPRRPLLWPLTLALLVALAVAVLSTLPRENLQLYQSAPPVALSALMRSVAWLTGGYVAFEALLAARRQMRDPGQDLPPAVFRTLLFGSLAFALVVLVAAGLNRPSSPGPTTLTSVLSAASFLPWWTVPLLAVIALVLAANGCLTVAARQMHALGREGALPAGLRRVPAPFPMPPLLFGALAALVIPLITWVPTQRLVELAADLFLVAMTLLNVAAIHSRRTEPERRRAFVVPFFPLVPAVAIAVDLVLISVLSPVGLLAGALWLWLGLVVYFAYSRRHQAAAREGVIVFGRDRRRETREGVFRVVVPLSLREERRLLLRLAAAVARQFDGEVIPLQVIPMSDPLAIEEGRRTARERNTLFQWSTRLAENVGVPIFPITRLAQNVSQGIIDTALEEGANLILMPWAVGAASRGARMGHVLDPVIRRAPCDLAVVAYHPERIRATRAEQESAGAGEDGLAGNEGRAGDAKGSISRVLVPTAGGPHAPLAVRIALALAREYGATITAAYIALPDASPDDLAAGRERIARTLAAVREEAARWPGLNGREAAPEEIPIESRVIAAESVAAGIATAGAGHDLVLIGASEESVLDQVLFGSVPEQVALTCPTPVIMVKRYRGLSRFWLQRAWDALDEALPDVTSEEQVEVYKAVRRGARPDVDFFVMMGLSTIIATFGLLQNSAAVIIGAMLVAPLFTPILAFSLAIVQGDVRLLRLAVEAALKGIALAIGLAFLLTAASPLRTVTAEIAARTHPNLFDLAVALASGAAGAYAIARKDVATSLPGVAIAAALVPPLAVVGIGLAMGSLDVAGGGGLLFTTNLIAITLAGSVTLLLLRFRPAHRAEREARLRVGLLTTLALLVLITIPLAAVFVRSASNTRTRQAIQRSLAGELAAMPGAELAGFEFEDRGTEVEVTVTVHVQGVLSQSAARQLSGELSRSIGRPVSLHVVAIPITTIDVPARQ